MMISALLLANSFITYDYYQEMTANIEKCIIKGIINNVSVNVDNLPCSRGIQLSINGIEGVYNVSSGININYCVGDSQIFNVNSIQYIGDSINYLVAFKDDRYTVISSTNVSKGVYKIEDAQVIDGPGTIDGNFANCTPTESYTKTTETIKYSNGYDLSISTTDSGKKVIFINGNPQLELNTLVKSANSTEEKLSNNNINLVENITKQLETEKLLDAYNKFTKIDFSIIPTKFKDFINYFGNKIGIELYKRNL